MCIRDRYQRRVRGGINAEYGDHDSDGQINSKPPHPRGRVVPGATVAPVAPVRHTGSGIGHPLQPAIKASHAGRSLWRRHCPQGHGGAVVAVKVGIWVVSREADKHRALPGWRSSLTPHYV
eukprot:TRINITY_DN310_c0_g1_i7.p2 TRINITY_DN310_c0_g1~~TRINITY_DN310_c0_g1_i7.p2  ORF type:complete len:121 (-),score=4.09 TRINITY_DN310_c0_g1_i7:493-855(-)